MFLAVPGAILTISPGVSIIKIQIRQNLYLGRLTESCEKICERLEANKFSYPYKHIAFEHMSHMMLEYCGKEIKYFIKSEKEDPAACFAERETMGKECVSWIQSVWQ